MAAPHREQLVSRFADLYRESYGEGAADVVSAIVGESLPATWEWLVALCDDGSKESTRKYKDALRMHDTTFFRRYDVPRGQRDLMEGRSYVLVADGLAALKSSFEGGEGAGQLTPATGVRASGGGRRAPASGGSGGSRRGSVGAGAPVSAATAEPPSTTHNDAAATGTDLAAVHAQLQAVTSQMASMQMIIQQQQATIAALQQRSGGASSGGARVRPGSFPDDDDLDNELLAVGEQADSSEVRQLAADFLAAGEDSGGGSGSGAQSHAPPAGASADSSQLLRGVSALYDPEWAGAELVQQGADADDSSAQSAPPGRARGGAAAPEGA